MPKVSKSKVDKEVRNYVFANNEMIIIFYIGYSIILVRKENENEREILQCAF